MKRVIRLHPAAIFAGMRKYVILLLIPLLRGVFSLDGGWREWLSGAWIDLCVLAAIAGLGALHAKRSKITLGKGVMRYSRGLAFRMETSYCAGRLATVRISHPLYLRAVKGAVVKPSGLAPERSPFYPLILRRYDAERVRAALGFSGHGAYRGALKPNVLQLAAVSASSSGFVAGAAVAAALLSNAAKLLGQNYAAELYGTLARVAEYLAFGLPPVALIAGTVLAAAFVMSFAKNFAACYRLRIARSDRIITVESGLFSRESVSINVEKITSTDVISRLREITARRRSVLVTAEGYGGKGRLSLLVPGSRANQALRSMRLLLPEFCGFSVSVKTDGSARMRFLRGPIAAAAIELAALTAMAAAEPDSLGTTLFWMLAALLWLAWEVLNKLTAHHTTGCGVWRGMLCLRYEKRRVFHRVTIPASEIVWVKLTSSIPQRRRGLADLVVGERSSKKRVHRIRSIDRAAAERLLKSIGIEA